MSTVRLLALLLWPLLINDLYVIGVAKRSLVALWVLDFLIFVTIPSLTLWYLNRSGVIDLRQILRRPRTELQRQFSLPPSPVVAHIVVAGLLCVWSVIVFWGLVNPIVWTLLPSTSHGYEFPNTQPMRAVVVAYAAITTGFLEEVIFRGVILERFQRTSSLTRAILLSSLPFGLAHWHGGLAPMAMAALWAVPVSLYYATTENLWVPILWHTLYDLACWNPFAQGAA